MRFLSRLGASVIEVTLGEVGDGEHYEEETDRGMRPTAREGEKWL